VTGIGDVAGIGPIMAAGWLAGWVLAARIRPLPRAAGATPRPEQISVVIPARDEEKRLPGLLAALAADQPGEVIVVDDSSSDGTATIATAAGARVLGAAPPPGWAGKSWACWRGGDAACGEVLVFLDADTRPAAGFVSRLAASAVASGGLVSVQPHHRAATLYERLSATCALVAVLGAGTGRRPVAYGPAMAIPRAAYLSAGGHQLAASDVAEDLALAAALHERGVPVSAYVDDGSGITVRMYPEGPGQLVEGWTKNLAAGAAHVSRRRSVLVGIWVTGALLAAAGGPLPSLLVAVQHAVLLRRVGHFGLLTALLWPLPLAAFVALFVRSAVHRLTGRPVAWRGRRIAA
jgi:4,4'-diaponeurosporenoate glycosyltransferase